MIFLDLGLKECAYFVYILILGLKLKQCTNICYIDVKTTEVLLLGL